MLRRPLFWAAVTMTAGLLVPIHGIAWGCWAAWALVALSGAACLACHASSERSLRLAGVTLMAGFFAAGHLAADGAARREPDDFDALLERNSAMFEGGVTLTGELVRVTWPGSRAGGEADDVELLLDVRRVEAGRLTFPARGRVRLRAPATGAPVVHEAASWVRGATIRCFARVLLPSSLGNPGAFDSRRHLLTRGIRATGTIKSWRLVDLFEPAGGGAHHRFLRLVDRLRTRLLQNLEGSFARNAAGRRACAVGGALLLGERGGLTSDDALALQQAGLSHLLAVSGFNVAVLAALLMLSLRTAGVPNRSACVAIVPALCLYLLLNQEESSVARAVVMAVAWFLGRAMWRRPDLLSTLGLSALAILLTEPIQVGDPGFQLTFAATLSLIALSFVRPRPPARRRAGAAAWRAARFVLGATSATLAATLAAMIGTLPLVIEHFHRVTPGALPANLVAGPLMAAAFVVLVLVEIVSPVSGALARGGSWCATLLIDATFSMAETVNRWPWMSWRRADPGVVLQILFVLSLAWMVSRAAKGRLRGRAGGAAIAATVVTGALLAAPIDTRGAPEGLRVTQLDVGQGDAALIETPSRGRLLVDAGGSPRGDFDIGERVVSQALWAMGIESLDAVAVTHDDADHLGGAAAVVANFHPREVWLPEGAQLWPPTPGISRLRAAVHRTGATLRHLARGSTARLRGAEVQVMNPPASMAGGPADLLPDNERSLVLVVVYEGRHALLTGDAGLRTERLLAGLLPAIDLLKVGHHGSRSSSSAAFLAQARPKVAVISCGRNNRFGHPSPEVLSRLLRAGARVCRTDLEGAVSVELLGGPAEGTLLSPSCALSERRRVSRD